MSDGHTDPPVSPSQENELPLAHQIRRMRTLNVLADGIGRNMSDLLHSAKVQLQMTHRDLPEDHLTQDYIEQTLTSLSEIEDLVERLFTLSREERGDVEKQEVDLVAQVKAVMALAESAFPTEFTLRTRFDDDCKVLGVSAQLEQMVADLVTNAGARMEGQEEEHPTVLEASVQTVVADPDLAGEYLDVEPGAYVHLAVSDTARGDAGGEREAPGTAIAVNEDDAHLSLSHRIVKAHDGAMTVRGEPGEGITYNVYLPLASESDESSVQEHPDSSGPASAQHILVVDDDETVRTLENMRLSRLGHEVVTKADAQEALAAIDDDPSAFDVVLVDYHMPDMNGLELAHALREKGCEAAVVLMTGLSAQISEAKARVVGINHLLRKPVESADLRDLLAQLSR